MALTVGKATDSHGSRSMATVDPSQARRSGSSSDQTTAQYTRLVAAPGGQARIPPAPSSRPATEWRVFARAMQALLGSVLSGAPVSAVPEGCG